MNANISNMPKVGLYRNISIFFVIFTVMLLVAVFLLFSNQATIIVQAGEQEMNLDLTVEVKSSPDMQELKEKDVVAGRLVSWEKTQTKQFQSLSTKTANSEFVGKVEIVNNTNRNQPLLRTTQLQADNGVIVRTNEHVVVPASGSVEVDVFPKDPGSFQDINPQNLTIVLLGPSLQSEIYGVAKQALTDKPREVKILAQNDVNRAQDELLSDMVAEIKLEQGIGDNKGLIWEVINSEVDYEIGDETDSFTLTLTAKISGVELDQSQLLELLSRKINDFNLVGIKPEQIKDDELSYEIIDTDFGDGALIGVNYVLQGRLEADNPILDKSNFAGKTIDEVRQYLSSQELVERSEVYVSPYWKDVVPQQVKKIKVIVK